jgi:hypothetical protein
MIAMLRKRVTAVLTLSLASSALAKKPVSAILRKTQPE